jgi:hypothetical protein
MLVVAIRVEAVMIVKGSLEVVLQLVVIGWVVTKREGIIFGVLRAAVVEILEGLILILSLGILDGAQVLERVPYTLLVRMDGQEVVVGDISSSK